MKHVHQHAALWGDGGLGDVKRQDPDDRRRGDDPGSTRNTEGAHVLFVALDDIYGHGK